MRSLFSQKNELLGTWVAIMDHCRRDRGLMLSNVRTRCIRNGEIHEFLLLSEADAARAREERVDEVSYLGFAEFLNGGVIAIGDELDSHGILIGTVAGFDETHMPNHLHIVVKGSSLENGAERNLMPLERFMIRSCIEKDPE